MRFSINNGQWSYYSLKALGLDKLSDTGERVQRSADEQLEHLRATLSRAKAEGANQLDSIQKEVSERPLTSVAVAFAIGYVISRLLDRS
jgi:ElaB/YqjD/DUF883 family membrane-anchored ribosome-binding protein